jgi:hypothetical protein
VSLPIVEPPQLYMQKTHAQVSKLPIKLKTQNLNLTNLVPIALTAVYPNIMANINPPAIEGLSKKDTKKTSVKPLISSDIKKLFLAYHLHVDCFSIRM